MDSPAWRLPRSILRRMVECYVKDRYFGGLNLGISTISESSGRIYNYIYYRTGNQHDAEDLTARVFYRAMRHIINYQDRGLPISAWLYRIAHNLVANWHRDNSRRKEIPLDDGHYSLQNKAPHPERTLEISEEHEALLMVVRKLPPERQQLLVLKFVERLSNAEIGRIMGRTEGAIKSLYHRTLITLRDEYETDLAHLSE